MRGFAIFLDKRGDAVGFRFWPATGQTIQFVPIDAAYWRAGGVGRKNPQKAIPLDVWLHKGFNSAVRQYSCLRN